MSIPFGPADRTEENCVCLAARIQSFVRKRRSCGVDGRAPNGQLRKVKLMMEFVGGFAQNASSGPSYLRPDAIARQQHDRLFHAKPRSSKSKDPFGKAALRLPTMPPQRPKHLLRGASPHERWLPGRAASLVFADPPKRLRGDRPRPAPHLWARNQGRAN